jgi:hypothetical protein
MEPTTAAVLIRGGLRPLRFELTHAGIRPIKGRGSLISVKSMHQCRAMNKNKPAIAKLD